MLKKKYRLIEKDLKKVLHKWKPFFSYSLVLNFCKNKLDFNRFAIIIWSKSVSTNIDRNYFRRFFYEKIRLNNLPNIKKDDFYDFVFVVKKQTKLNKKEEQNIKNFEKDMDFLIKKSIV